MTRRQSLQLMAAGAATAAAASAANAAPAAGDADREARMKWWHEARFGKEHWQDLALIPRILWVEYLRWFRRVVGVNVRNGCELREIAPAANGLLAATVECAGAVETLYARRIVLATGQRRKAAIRSRAPSNSVSASCASL